VEKTFFTSRKIGIVILSPFTHRRYRGYCTCCSISPKARPVFHMPLILIFELGQFQTSVLFTFCRGRNTPRPDTAPSLHDCTSLCLTTPNLKLLPCLSYVKRCSTCMRSASRRNWRNRTVVSRDYDVDGQLTTAVPRYLGCIECLTKRGRR
jgi:hypothetical protein